MLLLAGLIFGIMCIGAGLDTNQPGAILMGIVFAACGALGEFVLAGAPHD